MDAIQKAKVRLEEWIHHSGHHMGDYEKLALELEALGKKESACQIRKAVDLAFQGAEHLKKALEALGT